jgi:hypothetical protein
MRQYLPELMPLVVDSLLDGGAVSKREVAVATLGQVIQSTGYMRFFLLSSLHILSAHFLFSHLCTY